MSRLNKSKLKLPSVIATGMGLIVATSCLMSLGQGAGAIGVSFIIAMCIACGINICTALSMAELNAIMPALTGGLAQYTLTCMGPFISLVTMVGGYLVCNALTGSAECAMFGNSINAVFHTGIPSSVFCVILLVVLMIVNLNGVDMFAKIQNIVAYGLSASLVMMGVLGILGIGTGEVVEQPWVLSSEPKDILSLVGLAFFLFLGAEFIIPVAKDVENPRKNVPRGMVLSLLIVLVMQILVVLGMRNYVPWGELAENTSPHILYGNNMLGSAGSVWMIVVSIFAVVSTVNSVMSSLPYICAGMAKIGLLPAIFEKRNKKGAPYIGILAVAAVMILINATGLSSADSLSFLILTGCVFWMISYIISNINVIILRKRAPKVPRTFKAPFGILMPLVGIVGNLFMIWNIDGNPETKKSIFLLCGAVFLLLSVYGIFWTKFVMKRKLFQPIPMQEVMAMENELYLITRRNQKASQKANKIKL